MAKEQSRNERGAIYLAGHWHFHWLIQQAIGVFVTSTRQVMSVIDVDEAGPKKKNRSPYIIGRQLNRAGSKEKPAIDQIGDMMDGTLFYFADSQARIQTTVVSRGRTETNKQKNPIKKM